MNETNACRLITLERMEQMHKHGYTPEMDSENNATGQLTNAANAIINLDESKWPPYWNHKVYASIVSKPRREQLVYAATFLAADIDRKLLDEKLLKPY